MQRNELQIQVKRLEVIVDSLDFQVEKLMIAAGECNDETDLLRHANGQLSTEVNNQALTIIAQVERINKLRKQRRWLVIGMLVEAAVIVVVVR